MDLIQNKERALQNRSLFRNPLPLEGPRRFHHESFVMSQDLGVSTHPSFIEKSLHFHIEGFEGGHHGIWKLVRWVEQYSLWLAE